MSSATASAVKSWVLAERRHKIMGARRGMDPRGLFRAASRATWLTSVRSRSRHPVARRILDEDNDHLYKSFRWDIEGIGEVAFQARPGAPRILHGPPAPALPALRRLPGPRGRRSRRQVLQCGHREYVHTESKVPIHLYGPRPHEHGEILSRVRAEARSMLPGANCEDCGERFPINPRASGPKSKRCWLCRRVRRQAFKTERTREFRGRNPGYYSHQARRDRAASANS